MCALYKRTYELLLKETVPDKQLVQETSEQITQTNFYKEYLITDLHIEFDVKFGDKGGTANDNKVTVWNLPQHIIAALEDSGAGDGKGSMNLTLTCAYAGTNERSTIIHGNISQINDNFNGTDRQTILTVRDLRVGVRDKKVAANFVTRNYQPIDPQGIMDWFVRQLTSGSGAMFKNDANTYKLKYPEKWGKFTNYAVSGNLWKEFTKFLKIGEMEAHTYNNVLTVVNKGEGLPNPVIPVIDSTQDLVGFPTIDTDNAPDASFGNFSEAKAFKVKTLLRTDIQVGYRIYVVFPRRSVRTSNTAVTGQIGAVREWTDVDVFIVTNVTHSGSYEGRDWYSEFRIERERLSE